MLGALFLLFSTVTLTLGLVYLGALLYSKRKEAAWVSACKEMEAALPTEAEQAIGTQWKTEPPPELFKGQVKNPEAIPMPKLNEMAGVCFQQAVNHEKLFEKQAAEVLEELTKAKIDDEVDLRNLSTETLESLAMRCRVLVATRRLAEVHKEAKEDEEFFRKTCEEAKEMAHEALVAPAKKTRKPSKKTKAKTRKRK